MAPAEPRAPSAGLTWVPALLIVLAGAGLRFWELGSVGISHWDAGSFTAGALGIGPYGKEPILVFYAPPLVPQFNRWMLALTGSDTGVIALHAALGTATVALTYAFGRRAFGTSAGLVAAAALAGMEYHVVYSRQPLTDATFTLLFLIAICALWFAFDQGRRMGFVAAGVACGLAMWTKYHGFFPMIVGAAALLLARPSEHGRSRRGAVLGWISAGLVALPFGLALLLYIERTVGVDVFRANRSTWLPEWGLYLLPQTGAYVARCLTSWVHPVVLALGVAGAIAAVRRRDCGSVLTLAWLALFLGTLPMYKNYPRLLVPMLPPLALCAGLGAQALLNLRAQQPRRLVGVAVAVAILAVGAWSTLDTLRISDRGYAEAAAFLRDAGPSDRPDVLVTQHSTLFYLRDAPNEFVCYDEPPAAELLTSGAFRYAVLDMRTAYDPAWAEFERDYPGGLEAAAKVFDNPLPEPFLVNVLGFDALERKKGGHRESLRVYAAPSN